MVHVHDIMAIHTRALIVRYKAGLPPPPPPSLNPSHRSAASELLLLPLLDPWLITLLVLLVIAPTPWVHQLHLPQAVHLHLLDLS